MNVAFLTYCFGLTAFASLMYAFAKANTQSNAIRVCENYLHTFWHVNQQSGSLSSEAQSSEAFFEK
ncbi:hypothetical protein ACFO3O_12270 [Dokdonia ponticola]|uniref:Secreted protein n=1 Tax=Dokdonia ponticola TaxID=2041041 RepID=A0ABV9HYX4_9FLAO